MRIFLSPCFSDKKIDYEFNGEKIIVTFEGQTEEFDFSNMPDGVLESIESDLLVNPIIEAKREKGELSVILLNFINEDATEEEKFPEWKVIE